MKSPDAYRRERKTVAEQLESFNRQACIHFAEILRLNDEQKRICAQLGEPVEDLIPLAYFESVYKLLCFGPKADRLLLMVGTADEIEQVVSRVQRDKGFKDETGFWIEL